MGKIADPGPGGGGGGGGGVSLPESGVVMDTPVQFIAGSGITLTAYPEQNRIVFDAVAPTTVDILAVVPTAFLLMGG